MLDLAYAYLLAAAGRPTPSPSTSGCATASAKAARGPTTPRPSSRCTAWPMRIFKPRRRPRPSQLLERVRDARVPEARDQPPRHPRHPAKLGRGVPGCRQDRRGRDPVRTGGRRSSEAATRARPSPTPSPPCKAWPRHTGSPARPPRPSPCASGCATRCVKTARARPPPDPHGPAQPGLCVPCGRETAEAVALLERVLRLRLCEGARGRSPSHPHLPEDLGRGVPCGRAGSAEAVALYERVRDACADGARGRPPPDPHHPARPGRCVSSRRQDGRGRRPATSECADARVKKLGADHPFTLATLASLALAYQAAEKPERALPLLQQAAVGFEKRHFVDSIAPARSSAP